MTMDPDKEIVAEPVEEQTMGPYRDVYLQELMEKHRTESDEQAAEMSAAAESEPEEGPSAPVWEAEVEKDDASPMLRKSRKAALVAALLKEVPDDE